MKVYALTQKYLEYCGCKVAKLKSEGKLYMDNNERYFYSEVPKRFEELEDEYFAKQLTELTVENGLAVELGLATVHERVLSISKMPYDCDGDSENVEFILR